MKVVALVCYDGSKFFGSQSQNDEHRTVLGAFERALNSVGIFESPIASSRTDTGVHALLAPIAFDVPYFWEDRILQLRELLNKKLYPYIKIRRLFAVSNDFHPRFDAKKRLYRYILKEGEYDPFFADYVTFVKNLNRELIRETIPMFEGRHDFAFFRKVGSNEKSTVRTILRARAYEYRDYFVLSFLAKSFLRSQVRLMVGALLELSDGKISKDALKEQLELKNRYTSRLAPPCGLYLSRVYY